ncbi:T9SS type A sorting domain-containing protein [Dyadobacter jejuensis]|nr:T9SS type A sorting domain-containing protein [Dyadobacter jejuensis]
MQLCLVVLAMCMSYYGMALAPTTYDCDCAGNLLQNASFESTASWQKGESTSFSVDNAYNVCGNKNGLISGSGFVYQKVQVSAGSKVNFSIYGGTHDTRYDHIIFLTFLDSGGTKIESSQNKEVHMDYDVGSQRALRKYAIEATAPAGTKYVKVLMYSSGNYFKMDAACLTATAAEPAECTSCAGNLLGNDGSFESGNTSGWYTDGKSFSASKTYAVCGQYGAVFQGPGSFWKRIPMSDLAGRTVSLSIWGAKHQNSGQKFFLIFQDADQKTIGTQKKVDITRVFDVQPTGLDKYDLQAVAPAGAKFIVIGGESTGDYIKVDAACVTISPSVVCNNCYNNLLGDGGGFEAGNTNGWTVTSGSFSASTTYAVCGNYGAAYGGSGSFYKDIPVNSMEGRTVSLKAWGAYHNSKGQKFFVTFLNASKSAIGQPVTVAIDKVYDDSPKGLNEYNLSAVAPSGAEYIRVGGTTTGDYIKVDALCLTITEPLECTSCTGNLVTDNPGFEGNNTTGWTSTGGTFAANSSYAACGSYSGVLSGAGTFTKLVHVPGASGNGFELKVWAAYDIARNQKISLGFLNSSKGSLSEEVRVSVDKAYAAAPVGLKLYTLRGNAPAGTEYISIKGSSDGDLLIIDAICLTQSGPPLPVTLVRFDAMPENSEVQLNWATTSESQSNFFEIQRSVDGKDWMALGERSAQGTSTAMVNYDFTDPKPISGKSLYRLKMVDMDGTFAYSRLVSVSLNREMQYAVYPNPTSDHVTVEAQERISKVELINTGGRIVYSARPTVSNQVDLRSLPQDTYLMRITTSAGEVVIKRIRVVH